MIPTAPELRTPVTPRVNAGGRRLSLSGHGAHGPFTGLHVTPRRGAERAERDATAHHDDPARGTHDHGAEYSVGYRSYP